jgi:hypothetical protein
VSATTTQQEFKCSCGRAFSHEVSLKRHRWVTGHVEAEGAAEAAVVEQAVAVVEPVVDYSETYAQALSVIAEKRAQMEQSDRAFRAQQFAQAQREAQLNQVRLAYAQIVSFFQALGVQLFNGMVKAASVSVVGAVALLLAAVLVSIGIGVGHAAARSSEAPVAIVSAQ